MYSMAEHEKQDLYWVSSSAGGLKIEPTNVLAIWRRVALAEQNTAEYSIKKLNEKDHLVEHTKGWWEKK